MFVPGFEHAFERYVATEPRRSAGVVVVAVAYPRALADPEVVAFPRAASPRPGAGRRPARRRHIAEAVAILAAGAVWALGGVMGWLGSGPLAAPGPDPSHAVPVSASVYVVQPGDTLWSIARSLQPTGEIRPLVDRLAAEEHGQPLHAGDTLTLP